LRARAGLDALEQPLERDLQPLAGAGVRHGGDDEHLVGHVPRAGLAADRVPDAAGELVGQLLAVGQLTNSGIQ
jgi:hypothetical protein